MMLRLGAGKVSPKGLALVAFVWASAGAHAATPVEDRSADQVQQPVGELQRRPIGGQPAPIRTPQPVLPAELSRSSEMTAGAVDPYAGAPTAAAAPPAGQNAQMFYELQQLQTEVLQLRGMLEDQAFEIQRLRELQRSQYLDFDQRLAGAGAPASVTPLTTPQPVVERPARSDERVVVQTGGDRVSSAAAVSSASEPVVAPTRLATNTTPVTVPSEQEAYTRAFELMKDQQFEQSILAYQGVVENFPDGKYAPESRYWLGELYLMSDRLEDARGAFHQVVDRFPAHQKVPLSLYKLGVVNHRLGVTPRALEYLEDVVVRYPDTPAAGLARTYAAELR